MSKPIADPRTGEILDEQVRPFAEMLTILDQGKAELSDAGINCEVMSGTAPSYA